MKTAPTGHREPDHASARRVRPVGTRRTELPADDDLSGDRDRVEHEREEDPDLERDLVRAELRVTHPAHRRPGQQERADQGGRADEHVLPERQEATGKAEHEATLGGPDPPREERGEADAHRGLRDRGSPGRAHDPETEPVDEDELEDDVEEVPRHEDHERRRQICGATKEPLRSQREEHGRDPDGDDPQVRLPEPGRLAFDSDEGDDRTGERGEDEREADADREGEPGRLCPESPGRRALSCAAGSRDLRGRPVLEEVEHREHPEHRRGGPERRQGLSAEMPDDRGVHEDVERLCRQSAERRERQPEDLPVVRRPEAQGVDKVTRARKSSRRARTARPTARPGSRRTGPVP